MNAKHLTAASVQQAAEQARRQTEETTVALALARARMEYTLAQAVMLQTPQQTVKYATR